MDTRLVTQEIRLRQWAGIIQDRMNCGLTVDAYCKEKNISRHAYFYWLRKIREAAISPGRAFVEIALPKEERKSSDTGCNISAPHFSPELVIETGRMKIQVDSSTPRELLKMVLEVTAIC